MAMESLGHQPRLDIEETIECWDDDGDLQFNEGIQFRATSSADSNAGDEDWQVFLQDNDEFSKEEALASAKHAGIPIPADIPSSALIGGAIKRLSTRKQKRTFVDDWSEDVELPDPDTVLELRTPQDTTFPESLRQVSSAATSPIKTTASPIWHEDISTRLQSAFTGLEQYQDENDSPVNHNHNQAVPTIRSPVPRSPQKKSMSGARANNFQEPEADDFDLEFELPPDHQPLQLSHRKQHTGVSSPTLEDFDLEWSEGSIGVRVGGTTRDGRSAPSSSISIASPSVSSCITGGSEDDGLDGIVFPEGPLDFTASLKKRQEVQAADDLVQPKETPKPPQSSEADDFFSGIEIDSGNAFSSGKLALNPNVKCKTEWPTSPTRRPATTLTFTNSSTSPRTRIPRLSGHERTHSTHLETVSESGAPLSKFRRSQSRLGHSAQSSVSSLPTSTTPSTSPTPTPSSTRRLLGQRPSREPAPAVNSNTPGRTLRTKRSLPSIRGIKNAESVQASQRSPSHPDGYIRSSFGRPKTPVDRTTVNDGRPSSRRPPAPFLPAGASERQSHHASVKSYRSSRRTNSDGSSDLLSPTGTFSRLSRSNRSDGHRLSLGETSTDTMSPSGKRTLTRPTKRRNFGDGTELESFDDLPTSVSTESKYTKNPIGRGAPRSVRAKLSQSRNTPPAESPRPGQGQGQLSTPPSTSKPPTSIPRFARDTNASRNAREQRIASMGSRNLNNHRDRDTTPLSSFNSNWKPQPQPISRLSPNAASVRSRKTRSDAKNNSKPHLIKPMGAGVQESKSVRGMRYNPNTYRWEGNENLVQEFDNTVASRSPKPAPALITNVGAVQNVQTVGGMVFDPHRMCWLRAKSQSKEPAAPEPDDEDDVFAGLDDLEDKVVGVGRTSTTMNDLNPSSTGTTGEPSAGESSDEGPITEEFDVGPEFIRRQRAEEEKWKRKVDNWVGSDRDRSDRETHWRWAIRDLVADGTA
ncbi:hypothetical protein N7481_000506 [Penicillium waksmanii]|uniref:uncharacterized protein n=1 Tax=Penicillium waksmanii TaxID=69791 RepID=UPI002547AC88|nr:uncharacterized protein N7481_000506 [Penicillium waksmanii]KAJ6000097.1 hypothetical protein N7481_000506 [Penicillium waksmanii]